MGSALRYWEKQNQQFQENRLNSWFTHCTYECQFRFIMPITRPDGRDGLAFLSPAEIGTRGASSALLGAR